MKDGTGQRDNLGRLYGSGHGKLEAHGVLQYQDERMNAIQERE